MGISGSTRLLAVLGDPIAHSLSPVLHNAAIAALGLDAVYAALRIPAAAFPEALNVLGGLGLAGNVTVPISRGIDDAGFLWLLNAVASYRFADRIGVHVAAGGIGLQGRGENTQGFSVGLGTDIRVFPHVKLLGEILHGGTTFDPGSDGTLVNFGIRIHGERISADIGGVRPLEDMGSLLFIPLISVGYRF